MHAPSGLLMNAFGHFCAFCERPLLDESWVWDARTGHCVDDAPGSAADWTHLYLLDRNCYEAQLAAPPVDPAALLLPDQPGLSTRPGRTARWPTPCSASRAS